MDSKSKYGDDENIESFMDYYIFYPVGDILLPLFYKLGITPNMITLMSTICTITSIYYINLPSRNFKKFAFLYILGYFFDCVDGRLARKYKLGSTFGMVFDSVSDIISNTLLIIIYVFNFYDKKNFKYLIPILIVISHKLSVNYGIMEAEDCYKKNKHDNFYKYKKKMLKNFDNTILKIILKKIYLMIHKASYQSYRNIYPIYNKEKIYNDLKKTKEIGFGNYSVLVILVIYLTMLN
tara:strand:+ start:1172 stop:1882 length:711 start_codon:yes stop_codon:yes gene_type:complete